MRQTRQWFLFGSFLGGIGVEVFFDVFDGVGGFLRGWLGFLEDDRGPVLLGMGVIHGVHGNSE